MRLGQKPHGNAEGFVHALHILGRDAPARSRRRRLSSVRICSVSTMLSLARPQRSARTPMWVGRRFLSCREVMAAAMTVGLWRLPISFWMISTGRTPPCSLPDDRAQVRVKDFSSVHFHLLPSL